MHGPVVGIMVDREVWNDNKRLKAKAVEGPARGLVRVTGERGAARVVNPQAL